MAGRLERRGFTLIELLVVIAIVVMLAGLLLSSLNLARQRGQSVRCLSNLHQWGLALQMYLDDHDEFIPRRGQGVQPLSQINRPDDWFNCLPPYVGMPAFSNFVVGGARAFPNSIFTDPAARDPGGTYFLPYAMNMYLSPWIRPQPHRLSEIPRPEQLAFLADGPGQYSSTMPSALCYSVTPRHAGRAHVVFLDGHVQSFAGDYLGCGTGAIEHDDIRWQTQTEGVNQTPVP